MNGVKVEEGEGVMGEEEEAEETETYKEREKIGKDRYRKREKY